MPQASLSPCHPRGTALSAPLEAQGPPTLPSRRRAGSRQRKLARDGEGCPRALASPHLLQAQPRGSVPTAWPLTSLVGSSRPAHHWPRDPAELGWASPGVTCTGKVRGGCRTLHAPGQRHTRVGPGPENVALAPPQTTLPLPWPGMGSGSSGPRPQWGAGGLGSPGCSPQPQPEAAQL